MFGKRLKFLRNKNNMTQEELAEKMHVNRTTLANWELGRNEPDHAMLIQIASFFNVSLDYLMGLTNERKRYSDTSFRAISSISDKLSPSMEELYKGTVPTDRLYEEENNTTQEMNKILAKSLLAKLDKVHQQIEEIRLATKSADDELDADLKVQISDLLNKALQPLLAHEKEIVETFINHWQSLEEEFGDETQTAKEKIIEVVKLHFPRLFPRIMALREEETSSRVAEPATTYSAKNLWGEPRPGVLAMLTEPLQKLYREMLAMPESPFAAFRMTGDAEVTDEMIASLVGFYAKAREQAQAMKKQSKTKNETEG